MTGRTHDTAERRRTTRGGRQRGCFIYIAAEQLQEAGIDPRAEPPWYRIWPAARARFIVQLYGEK